MTPDEIDDEIETMIEILTRTSGLIEE